MLALEPNEEVVPWPTAGLLTDGGGAERALQIYRGPDGLL